MPWPELRRRTAAPARSERALRWVLPALVLCVVASRAPAAEVSSVPPSAEDHRRVPVVFVPGVTGTRLEDPRDGRVVWGTGAQLLRPRDGGYELALPIDFDAARETGTTVLRAPHPQTLYEAVAPLWELRVPGWSKLIYRPLAERFASAGYRLGRLEAPTEGGALFFFNYDWRRGNLENVALLAGQLTDLAAARGGAGEVDLICQSNAARICRYLVKYGALTLAEAEAGRAPERRFSVRKVVLVGASNDGAVRSFQLLTQGRVYVPLVGRRFQPEIFFTLRTLFEDLPASSGTIFFDAAGRPLEADLYAAEDWPRYGWSIFAPAVRERLEAARRPDLYGDEGQRLTYLKRRLETAQRLHRLLAADSPHFEGVRYYRLENRSASTQRGALLTREAGGWRTFFAEDRRVAADPVLRALATAPGDGHATLASQRRLSPQEEAVMAGSYLAEGGHFEMVIAPESLDSLLSFLGD